MKNKRKLPELKPLFIERMKKLLTDKKDFQKYLNILKIPEPKSFRCNTLKIQPDKLKEKLEKKYQWNIIQPWKDYPEIMIINNQLEPGELGRALEHLLGYYYIQELSSMLPVIAMPPKENELVLDLCAAPGSKTTQIAAKMNNTGNIIANEISMGRLKILASNLERCGVSNTIITKKEGVALLKRFQNQNLKFNKIYLDAPCSGEGTLRSTPKTYLMWNINTVKQLSSLQKQMIKNALLLLNKNGQILYSTCTHSPEENEEIIDYLLKEFPGKVEVEKINLPIKPRQGITKWNEKKYSEKVKNSCRVYPHDNNTEGFFLAKIRKI